MRTVLWTKQAQADLAAIRAFINQDSPHYASVIVSRLIAATDRLIPFPDLAEPFQNSMILLFEKSCTARTESWTDWWVSTRSMC